MFDGDSNVQLGWDILKTHYPTLDVIYVVEHTVSLFFNDVSKAKIMNQIIRYHKEIYNLFGSRIDLFYSKTKIIWMSWY